MPIVNVNEDLSGYLTSADAASTYQTILTFDDNPTSGSDNPVKSNGIYSWTFKDMIFVEKSSLSRSLAVERNYWIMNYNMTLEAGYDYFVWFQCPDVGINGKILLNTPGGIYTGLTAGAYTDQVAMFFDNRGTTSYTITVQIYTFKVRRSDTAINVYNIGSTSIFGYLNTMQELLSTQTVTLSSASWSSNTQTVSVTGVTSTSKVFVSPDPTSATAYGNAGVLCTAQGSGTLTFTCATTPSSNLTVNVVIG